MESAPRKPIHPLIATASVAVIVFSAVGVAAIMGLIPSSKSTPEQVVAPVVQPSIAPPPDAQQPALVAQLPAPVAQPPAPSAQQPAPAARPKVTAATPSPASAKPAVAQQPAAPIEPVWTAVPIDVAPQREPAQVAAAERPAPIPRPICVDCGTVEYVREVKQAGEGSGVGAIAGAVGGAVLGRQIGSGRGRDLATVAGVVGGAVAGHQIEKHVKSGVVYEISVRMEDGSMRIMTESNPPTWRAGDKVRVQGDRLAPQG